MKSYIILQPKTQSAICNVYGLYEITSNGTYTKPRAFSGMLVGNVQSLIDLIPKDEPFQLEVRGN